MIEPLSEVPETDVGGEGREQDLSPPEATPEEHRDRDGQRQDAAEERGSGAEIHGPQSLARAPRHGEDDVNERTVQEREATSRRMESLSVLAGVWRTT